jgi:hypothetical protein
MNPLVTLLIVLLVYLLPVVVIVGHFLLKK